VILSVLIFIIFINISYAACLEPDISTYNSCTGACPDAVAFTEDFAECVNVCIGEWNDIQDEYYSCLKAKREEPEEVAPPSKTVHSSYYSGTGYSVNSYEGEVKLTRGGVVFSLNSNFNVVPGDSIKTGDNSQLKLVSDDSTTILEEDTLAYMLHLDFEKNEIVSAPGWDEDPNYKHEFDNLKFWSDTLLDLADFVDKNRPTKIIEPCEESISDCAWGFVDFIKEGAAWFDEKIEKDYGKRIVVTPTAAVIPIGTKFIVEVAPDGATTVTTLNGTVIVMDLKSRKSVILEVNQKITIPNTSKGLGEQELQQSLTEIDPKSIDKWWIKDKEKPESKTIIFPTILLMVVIAVGIIILLAKKRKKKQ